MNGRFKPGDHLQVRRWYPLPYHHHGIYVSDDRVVQFGPGITGKREAKIEAVPLKDFEHDGIAEVVQHGRRTLLSGYLFEADEPWKIVARAEFLLKLQPRLPYNLVGHNCEHIANMCVAGGYTESHQVRTMFGVRALVGMPLFFRYSYLVGRNRPVPKGLLAGMLLSAAASQVAIFVYNREIKRFWDEIRGPWRAHERALSQGQAPPEVSQ